MYDVRATEVAGKAKYRPRGSQRLVLDGCIYYTVKPPPTKDSTIESELVESPFGRLLESDEVPDEAENPVKKMRPS